VPWEAEGTFDGISIYKLDSKGKIYEHSVTNVAMRDPPLALATNPLLSLNLKPAQTPQLGSWMVGKEEEKESAHGHTAPSLPRSSHSSVTVSAVKVWLRFYTAMVSSLLLFQGLSRFVRGRRFEA
jgi:hypothetical protein